MKRPFENRLSLRIDFQIQNFLKSIFYDIRFLREVDFTTRFSQSIEHYSFFNLFKTFQV
jgi:hypothetical protein